MSHSVPHLVMNLANASIGTPFTVKDIGGHGSFRRRLLELGLVPGTTVTLLSVAPLRDPMELLIRGASMSIRRAEAALVTVSPSPHATREPTAPMTPTNVPLGGDNWAGSTP